jgi:hypothetical protein
MPPSSGKRVLLFLAQRAGEVGSVDPLLDTFRRYAVFSVYQAVGVLRCALGDGPTDPPTIASVLRQWIPASPTLARVTGDCLI